MLPDLKQSTGLQIKNAVISTTSACAMFSMQKTTCVKYVVGYYIASDINSIFAWLHYV